MKARKLPVVVEVHQWFENGDHPGDHEQSTWKGKPSGTPFLTEGKVVRYFRRPGVSDEDLCAKCNDYGKHVPMKDHGWIDTLEGGHIVCPEDWIITGVHGEHYPCKPDIFEKTYEIIPE